MNEFYSKIQDPIAAIEKLGKWFAFSGMFGCKKEEQGCVLAMACLVEQRNPMDYLRRFHVFDGRLSMKADAMLSDFMEAGGTCVWKSKIDDCDEAKAVWCFGENKNLETTYSMADAKREGNAEKDNYKKAAPDMLRARLISKTIRMIAPKVVAGCYTPEEFGGEVVQALADSQPPKTKTVSITHEVEKKVDVPIKQSAPIPKSAEDEKSEAEMGLAPLKSAASAGTTSVSVPSNSQVASSSAPDAPAETPDNMPEVEALLKGANAEDKANAWLLKNKWIKEGQDYKALNKNQCANILRRPQNFIKAIN